jgi:hypothetical protein
MLAAVMPLFVAFPVVLITLELTGLLAYAPVNWAIASGLQILFLLCVVTSLRRHVARFVNDRRVLAMPFLVALFIFGHRIIALATGSSYEVMFAYDFLTAISIGAIMTYLVDRRAWPVIVLNATLFVLALAQPGWAPRLWLAFTLGMPLVVGTSLLRSRDRLRGDTSRSTTSRPGSTPRPSSRSK